MPYPTLILKSGRERSVLNQHAWIYSGAIKEFPENAQLGDIVRITDNKGAFLAFGFYAPKSQIVARLFYFGKDEIVLNRDFWKNKIHNAYSLRKNYIDFSQTNTYRLLHAEGDFLPGVIVDIYKDTASIQIVNKGAEHFYEILIETLKEIGISYIYLKTKENSRRLEKIDLPEGWIIPREEEDILVEENGIKFSINIEKGQKTGFFIDQRDNRQLLKQYATGKKILNTFAYTGGFSVYAVAAGATEVVSVDIAKDACQEAEKNMLLNFPDYKEHQIVMQDCFNYLKDIPENYYDIIVLDPPAFAKTAQNVPNASRGYKEINMKALKKIKSGGLLFTFSCSGSIDRDLFRKIVFGAAADVGRNVRIIHQLTQPIDHPINIY
ncbi:MAG: class I SAM-dependent rRNA methyltransferase, partial [Thermonemataceae bacterium]|nr:class I SAM-dependent rRNA methyltransferase [Thermonemataceae bacterium]